MKKCYILSLFVLIFLFVGSCAQQTKKPGDTVYLDELEGQKKLEGDQQDSNYKIVGDYSKKKEIITKIEAQDRIEQKKLIKKQEDIEEKTAQLQKEIEQKLGGRSSEIAKKDDRIQELIDMGLSPEELAKRLSDETELSEKDIGEVVASYKLQQMIASSQSEEELVEVLKESTELKADEIKKIVEIKQQVLDNQRELRKETLKKIHERLVRNRQLNLETVFCSRTSKLDQLVLNPVFYPFDIHSVSKEYSSKLYNDFDLIAQELKNYPDMMLQLEGNCDYKGSNKYNKALGDRRWSGVLPLLTSLGYSRTKVRGISKGEECPTPKLLDDENWRAQNRRTDFVWVLK